MLWRVLKLKSDDEPPKPAKRCKQGGNSQNDAELIARVAAIQADNQ